MENDRVEVLLQLWDACRNLGVNVSPEQLCARQPELIEMVRKKIEAIKRVDAVLDLQPTLIHEPAGPPDSAPAAVPVPKLVNGAAEQFPRKVGRFTLIRELGRGGFGVVYEARDMDLKRSVAIKTLKPDIAAKSAARELFEREQKITSRLEHPGIVPVHESGKDDQGRPFFAMRKVGDGTSFDDLIAKFHADHAKKAWHRLRLDFFRLLQQYVTVCKTVAYAHKRGIVHRDIKPANVIVGNHGEVLVIDWGIANRHGRPAQLNGTLYSPLLTIEPPTKGKDADGRSRERRAGTPGFMSPEQFDGDPSAFSIASDVYSLGATLYVILTGRSSMEGASLREAKWRTSNGKFPRPRDLNPDAPRALEAVCLKAMAHEPGERFRNAEKLARELERWLSDKKVNCFHEPRLERLWRWANRHRAAVGNGVLAVIALLGCGLAYFMWQSSEYHSQASKHDKAQLAAARENEKLRDRERQLKSETEYMLLQAANASRDDAERRKRRQIAMRNLALCQSAWFASDTRVARERRLDITSGECPWEYHFVAGREQSVSRRSAPIDRKVLLLRGLKMEGAFKYRLDCDSGAVIFDERNEKVDVQLNQIIPEPPPANAPRDRAPLNVPTIPIPEKPHDPIVYSPDNRLAAVIRQNDIEIQDRAGRSITRPIPRTWLGSACAMSRSVEFSPDGRCLAVIHGGNEIRVHDTTDGWTIVRLIGAVGDVQQMVFSDDGLRLASSEIEEQRPAGAPCNNEFGRFTVRLWRVPRRADVRPDAAGDPKVVNESIMAECHQVKPQAA